MFCLNKFVNEHQWMPKVLNSNLLVPADPGQTPDEAKTNLSVSKGLGILMRGPDSLSMASSQLSALPDWYKSSFS